MINRGVAQLVARMVRDHKVVGSNPVASTKIAGERFALPLSCLDWSLYHTRYMFSGLPKKFYKVKICREEEP